MGTPIYEPYLELEARSSRRIAGTYLYVDMEGPPRSIRTDIWADAPLSRAEIYALLLQQAPVGSLAFPGSSREVRGITELFQRWVTGVIEYSVLSKLEEAIASTVGLDIFGLETVSDGRLGLKIGKEVADRFYLTYTKVLSPLPGGINTVWGIEYRISRGLFLNLSLDNKDNLEAWVQARYLFDILPGRKTPAPASENGKDSQ
ncbi:MAG: translocation/assembly module TamB domain-containing protein [Armatimonadetes bacterium]|nr:translocation/assembly module TamB domain-containing protein [Armatimonadota bacterium]